ncbi:hypothetical protein HJC23_003596 [Cyclotella cryptica]|uniref:Amino acid transporter transmembrane domain-containing protein n=1 Tax=Cyclotella cryptica TaxID=29204 RepID=A0ABD3QIJ9_9STRA|eukprot:CCRYP_004879-RA/>CCRYP_004879-RA protein AED:0.00 eAED:0.00 QI:286/-1/1/1/-1/1/1/70/640
MRSTLVVAAVAVQLPCHGHALSVSHRRMHSSSSPRFARQFALKMSTLDKPAASPSSNSVNPDDLFEHEEASSLSLLPLSPSSSSSSPAIPSLLQKVLDKVGKIDESRLISSPEYLNGQEPKLFSNLVYDTIHQPADGTHANATTLLVARPSSANLFSSSALLCGTALGSGLLFLPTAIAQAGYLPTIVATLIAWAYMTISALLTAELLINRCGETGRVRNVGLLELYSEFLGPNFGKVAALGFVVVSYVMMGVYFGEGGDFIAQLFQLSADGAAAARDGSELSTMATTLTAAPEMASTVTAATASILQTSFASRTLFASLMAVFLATASKYGAVQRVMTNILVPSTLLAFVIAIATAFPTADFSVLLDSSHQHPELVLNAFPLLFMSWTYHGVVPRVVYNLEADKNKITKAIVGGSTTALLMYLIWNAVVLGNVLGDKSLVDATAAAAAAAASASNAAITDPINLTRDLPIQPSIALVSELAVITSLIGVVLGFVNEFYDAIGALPSQSYGPKDDKKWQVALLTLTPPVVCSILLGYYNDPSLRDSATSTLFAVDRYQVMEYTGAFGASILFLILPALMVWQNRYGDDARPLTVKPMFPFGKLTLGSLYKAAGTLIVEQGLEKLGVFEFVQEHFLRKGIH